jgi:hypothetical protein
MVCLEDKEMTQDERINDARRKRKDARRKKQEMKESDARRKDRKINGLHIKGDAIDSLTKMKTR